MLSLLSLLSRRGAPCAKLTQFLGRRLVAFFGGALIAGPYHVATSVPPIIAHHPPKSVDGDIGNRVQNMWHIRVSQSLNCAHTSNWLKPRNETPRLVLNEIVQKMGEYGISVTELTGRKPSVQPNELAAKYRDPVSGSAWSGRGRAPAWTAGKDRNDFLVDKRAAPHAMVREALFPEGH